jgi:hypothetical protein
MTLQELLPTIRELSAAEKWELRALLDDELSARSATVDEVAMNGPQFVAMFQRRFGDLEPVEIEIPQREPVRIDETLFSEFGDA